MDPVDITKSLKEEHQGKWIAYSPSEEKIYEYDQSLEKLIEKIEKLDVNDLTLQHVIPFDRSFAPTA